MAPAQRPFDSTSFLTTAAAVQQKRLTSEVQRITEQAWTAALLADSPDARLKAAKQEALRLIHGLSPSIRRDVENAFTSQKWAPLLAAAPEPSVEKPNQPAL